MITDIIDISEKGAKIKVVGVGGGGGNAVNNMVERGITNVDFIACNTDIQALGKSLARYKVQIGKTSTRGLGAGGDPERGREACEEDREEIAALLNGADMVFITAGMGGGTGTGAAPVVAQVARSLGALTVGVVTRPFTWEGVRRKNQADRGIEELRKYLDTLVIIPNGRLMAIVEKNVSLPEAFNIANNVLYDAAKGISDLINIAGLVNVDFADVRSVMSNMGDALMGIGRASGENRAIEAAQSAISSPLLDGVNIAGSQGVLVNITGGKNISLYEVNDANMLISQAAGEDANVIFGAVIDESLEDEIIVTVIATGFNHRKEKFNAPPAVQHTVPVATTQSAQPIQQTPVHPKEPAPIIPIGTTGELKPKRAELPGQESLPFNEQKHGYSGTENLVYRNTPTYERKGIDISRANNPEERKERISKEDPEKPAFLRRIMD